MVEEQDYCSNSKHLLLARISAVSAQVVATAPTRWSMYVMPEYDVFGEGPAVTRFVQGCVNPFVFKRALA
jgi:hypothetical protein